jgi:hypothetical protein
VIALRKESQVECVHVSEETARTHILATQTHIRKALSAVQGDWWRFDRYEIKDGVIRPAAGACLKWYDPWLAYRKVEYQKGAAPPYEDLLQLTAKLRSTLPGRPHLLTKASETVVLEWCKRNGPLGILLARWESLTLATEASRSAEIRPTRYVRAYGQGVVYYGSSWDVEAQESRVMLHALDDLRLVEEPLDKTWRRFFPTVSRAQARNYPYPVPYTEEFCRLYAEPLVDFVHALHLFAGAIESLRAPNGDGPPANDLALNTINLLRRSNTPVIEQDAQGKLHQIWETPSLLASFAEMFAQDIAYGRTTRLCEGCQLPFVSNAYQARFCSQKCRWRHNKRNQRKKPKRAKSLFPQDQSTPRSTSHSAKTSQS